MYFISWLTTQGSLLHRDNCFKFWNKYYKFEGGGDVVDYTDPRTQLVVLSNANTDETSIRILPGMKTFQPAH